VSGVSHVLPMPGMVAWSGSINEPGPGRDRCPLASSLRAKNLLDPRFILGMEGDGVCIQTSLFLDQASQVSLGLGRTVLHAVRRVRCQRIASRGCGRAIKACARCSRVGAITAHGAHGGQERAIEVHTRVRGSFDAPCRANVGGLAGEATGDVLARPVGAFGEAALRTGRLAGHRPGAIRRTCRCSCRRSHYSTPSR
jgi:hypothetical protein